MLINYSYIMCFILAISQTSCATSFATPADPNMPNNCYRDDCSNVFNINKSLHMYKGGHHIKDDLNTNIEDCIIRL